MRSPGISPWVPNANILYPERSSDLTICSVARLPMKTSLVRSASTASAMLRTSSAVSGRRGSVDSSALSSPCVLGAARSRSGRPRTLNAPRLVRDAVCIGLFDAARAACWTLKYGRRAGLAAGSARNVANAVTDGSAVTAWSRASQGTDL